MARRRDTLNTWRAWRSRHYHDGTPRVEDELSFLLEGLLSTRRGAIAVLRADRRYAKYDRPQHTPPADKDADYLHAAYGRRRGKA